MVLGSTSPLKPPVDSRYTFHPSQSQNTAHSSDSRNIAASVIGFLKGKSAIAIAKQFGARGDTVSTVGFEVEQVKAYSRDPNDPDDQGRC